MIIDRDIKAQFSDQVRKRLISQLINGISTVLQNLLRYFSGTHISEFFVPSFLVRPIIFFLYLNETLVSGKSGKSIILLSLFKAGSSL